MAKPSEYERGFEDAKRECRIDFDDILKEFSKWLMLIVIAGLTYFGKIDGAVLSHLVMAFGGSTAATQMPKVMRGMRK
ncbi:hypothetical protein AHIS1_p053 [Acaryochloris phage A-HIS1]|nr:hypothetical protein AHIS1_p053 [Acaryochloris phage A-HIS1]